MRWFCHSGDPSEAGRKHDKGLLADLRTGGVVLAMANATTQEICNHPARAGVLVITLIAIISARGPAAAADFNHNLRRQLRSACALPADSLGPNLAEACSSPGAEGGDSPVGGVFSTIVTSPEAAGVLSIQERLQVSRQAKEKKVGTRDGRPFASGAQYLAQRGELQLPPAGGASPDIVFGMAPGMGVFLSAGASVLHHHNNDFEDGYEAQLPTVTLGADYRVNEWLIAGLAFNYTNYDGTYDDGGGFNKHIFGPLLYATFAPFGGTFVDLVLGYARQENSNNRRVRSEDPVAFPVSGHASADYSENQYLASILGGYDKPFGNVLIGPRLGLTFSYEDFGSIKEEGDTGLELRYNNLNQTSVQSSLGIQASVDLDAGHSIVVRPQAAVAWVHEYANSARNIDARLIEAPATGSFTFNREPPARDWASIGLGASALLPNGLQPFVQFATIQGNENFVSYGGTAGLRFGF